MYLQSVLLYLPEFICCRMCCYHHLRCYSSSIISLGQEPLFKNYLAQSPVLTFSLILSISLALGTSPSILPWHAFIHSLLSHLCQFSILPFWKWLRTRTPQYLILYCKRRIFSCAVGTELWQAWYLWYLLARLRGRRVKWSFILSFIGVFFRKSKRTVLQDVREWPNI